MKARNLTAKHAHRFNKPAVHKNRKKAQKRGEQKHKSRSSDRLFYARASQPAKARHEPPQ